jgi:4-alpha-glucanotransferase
MEPGLGVLAHLTSLPADEAQEATSALGTPAFEFVDWLADAGVRYWQVLPVNPTDEHGSPYAGISAFAGNDLLLGSEGVIDDARLEKEGLAEEYQRFCEREADWLDPYACFMAIRQKQGDGVVWQDWPKRFRRFDRKLVEGDAKLAKAAEVCKRAQFAFDRQWRALKSYANERGVLIIGDMPIYVSGDSADVWANPQLFKLGSDGKPEAVAGCPPDAFAEEGQIWGNPVYDWDELRSSGYAWWMRRLERAFQFYDILRLDHFIGFSRYFKIPAGEKASAGSYYSGPGFELFQQAFKRFGALPIVAEDLGTITPGVRCLVSACGFPGMDIVQFVDGNDPLPSYVPRPERVAYTGTHDNQTLVGYCEARYPELDAVEAAQDIARNVATCSAPVAIVALQDLMGLGNEARMNVPGVAEGNWTWQACSEDLKSATAFARELVELKNATEA